MGRTGSGVERRDTSIRIAFVYQGQTRRETLRTDGKPMPPTPANLKYAHRLAAEIKEKIRHGTFVYADYFPASPNATTGHGTLTGEQLDTWLGLQVGKEASTLKGYRVAVNWWKARIGAVPLKALKHSAVLAALATEPTWSGKTRNNKVSVLRQALDLAIRDEIIGANPVDGIESAPHQSPVPDPFSIEEVEAILQAGARKARALATPFMQTLRQAVGLRALTAQPDRAQGDKATARAALPSFKQYREADGRFYFKLTDAHGAVLLQSQGFESPRDAGQAVKRLQTEGAAALQALAPRLQATPDLAAPALQQALEQLLAAASPT